MSRSEFLYKSFISSFGREPSPCQDSLFHGISEFLTSDDADIMVVNGYAGTGKTSALSAVVEGLGSIGIKSRLLAPTGRAAKVFSGMAGLPAHTIHKEIYRQKSVGADGYGQFTLMPNKAKSTLFVVDEVSLIGIDSMERQSSALFGTGNLLEDLISFVRSGADCRLVLVGDDAQLPPVGLDSSPALNHSYMDGFGGVMYASLSTVVRQEGESGILANATKVRDAICSLSAEDTVSDLHLKPASDFERIGGGELIEKITDAIDKYGEDSVVVLCRSNKRAIRYNLGIRSTVLYREEQLVHGENLMIVKNCYQFCENVKGMDYIANGDVARLLRIHHFEERYGLHFADATLSFPDYSDQEIDAKVCLDTLQSESASLSYEQQNTLYQGVSADYSHLRSKKKIWEAVREDKYFNALQLKYASAITCHKSQGGEWPCVFIDCPFWQDEQTVDDLKWLYTAITRAVEKVYLVNFPDRLFV